MRRLQLVHTARRFTSTFSREATNLGARRWEKEPLSEVLRVLPTKFGEVRIAADAIFEVVLRLAMAREVDGLGLRMQIHHEGNDRCGEIAANVVRNVALAVVLVDLHDAVHGVFLLFEIVVARESSDQPTQTCSSGTAHGSHSPSLPAGGHIPYTR